MIRNLFTGLVVFLVSVAAAEAQTPPAEFLGREIGADRTLVGWDEIVRYVRYLEDESDRVHVEELGRSTLDRPFLLVVVADEDGLSNLDDARRDVRRLYDVNETSDDRAREIARDGRAIIAFSLGLHSTEVGASQASLEMLFELATREDEWMQRAREDLLILMVPSMNPDGLDIIVDWYDETVGTEAEGTNPPWLYHHYAGHDNNRDGFFNNLVETAMWSRVLYHDWMPQMIVDEHQMGNGGPRLFLPPFDDPLSPSVHPLVYAQLSAAGQQTVSDLTALGWTGIATSTIFTGEWPGSVRSTGFWHNMLGILSEVASARLATPLYFPPGSLRARGRGLPEYERRANFLQPWEGGWWRLRDIIDLEKDITWSMLQWASHYKEDLLYNFYQMNRDAAAQGKAEPPHGFVIDIDQTDSGSAVRLAELLRAGGVELGWREGPFEVEGASYPHGAFVVSSAQPFRPFLVEMLDSPPYPMIRENGGDIVQPYDVTAWRLPDLLGVKVQALQKPMTLDRVSSVDEVRRFRWPVPDTARVSFPASDNASYAVVNALLEAGSVRRVLDSSDDSRAGDFIVTSAPGLDELVAEHGARPRVVDGTPASRPLKRPRVGLYSPWGGSMDEGWTRLVLDRYGFASEKIDNDTFRRRKPDDGRRLRQRFDVILFASISQETLLNGAQSDSSPKLHEAKWAPRYRGGIGGKEAGSLMRQFVELGGTVITFNASTEWAVEFLGLPVVVELSDLSRDEFYAPGTLLQARFDEHPLTWGMPPESAVYFARGRSFRPLAWPQETAVPVRYAEHDVGVAGFLSGEDRVAGRPALIDVPMGEGRVVLFGFSPQRRAQTEATFKLVFNAILRAGLTDENGAE